MPEPPREIGKLHDWREKFWARRYRSIVVSHEESATRFDQLHG